MENRGEQIAGLYLEIVVLVEGSSRELRHETQGGHVHVLTGEEEERHAAAVSHAVLGQRVVDICLGLEKDLKKKIHKGKKENHIMFLVSVFNFY